MKTVGIIQPNYIPWRGYFDFINKVDHFIFLDDVQYTKRDWRNRNKVRQKVGDSIWLTVPVNASRDSLIMDAEIDQSEGWVRKHLQTLENNYGKAPFFHQYFEGFKNVLESRPSSIADLDITLCRKICEWLSIDTELSRSSDYDCQGIKDRKLIALTQAVDGTHYLSGPSARNYIQDDLWTDAGIKLEYIEYPAYAPYPQISEPFDPYVSVLDLIFMEGPAAPAYIWGK